MTNLFESLPNPKNLPTATIKSLVLDQRGGASFKPEHFTDTGFPVLHKGAIKSYGEIALDKGKKTYTSESTAERFAKSEVNSQYVAVTLRDLVPSGPTIGMASNLCNSGHERYILAQGAYGFKFDTNRLDPNYFVWLTNTVPYRKLINALAVGSTQIHVRTPIFTNIKIPLPKIDEQKRIAAILEEADHTRRTRRFTDGVSDTFLQEVFVEMFGDPVTNPMGWEVKKLGKLVTSLDSQRIPLKASDREQRQGKYPYYGATGAIDFIDDFIFEGENLLVTEDGKSLKSRNRDLAFKVNGKYWVNNHAHVLSMRDQVDIDFLCQFLNLTDIDEFVTGIDQYKLNASSLKQIPIFLPPKNMQVNFASIVREHQQTQQQQQESARQAEHLFQTLLHQAFRGEL